MKQHPLEVKGAESEKRYKQSKYELFRPSPFSIAIAGISTSGKSSIAIHIANVTFPVFEHIILVSKTHRLDVSWNQLKERIAERNIARGEHPDTHPFVFDSTLALPKIVHEQTMRVREAKESDAKVMTIAWGKWPETKH